MTTLTINVVCCANSLTYLMLCDVDEKLLLQKLLQDVFWCHVN